MNTPSMRRFLKLAQITLVFVYLVIIAGSVVRATGAGMGCPDWPKCFGHWIPPTDASQLPSNYRSFYKVQEQSAEPFNALKTWTEYGNRLVGAVLGLLMFAQVLAAFRMRKSNSFFLKLALATLLLTGMEGVLGAIVVYNNLKAGVITIHMFLSLIILVTQSFLVFRVSLTVHALSQVASRSHPTAAPLYEAKPYLKNLIIFSFLMTTVQILLGTQVRESVDVLMKNFDINSRGDILNFVGWKFSVHASFALFVTLLNLFLLIKIVRDKILYALLKPQVLGIAFVLLLEMIAGTTLKLFALPALVQPVHLLLAALLFGLQWGLVLRSRITE